MSELVERNYYELLGLERGASDDEIRASYKELVRIFHPDSNFFSDIIADKVDGEADAFKLITEAYQTLTNQKKRADYDQSLPPVLKDWSAEASGPVSDQGHNRDALAAHQPTQQPVVDKAARSQIFGAPHNTRHHEQEVAQVPSVFDLLTRRRTVIDRILDFLRL